MNDPLERDMDPEEIEAEEEEDVFGECWLDLRGFRSTAEA